MSHRATGRVGALSATILVLALPGIESACGHHGGDANAPSLAYGTESGQNVKAQLFTVPTTQKIGQWGRVRKLRELSDFIFALFSAG